jgi:hypothetical protein
MPILSPVNIGLRCAVLVERKSSFLRTDKALCDSFTVLKYWLVRPVRRRDILARLLGHGDARLARNPVRFELQSDVVIVVLEPEGVNIQFADFSVDSSDPTELANVWSCSRNGCCISRGGV